MFKVNDHLVLKCSDITNQGMGVAKADRFPFFVEKLLPQEVAEIQITQLKSKYGFGKIVKLLEAAPTRILPICPHFNECGGCQIMMLDYKRQLDFKQRSVNDTLNVETTNIFASPLDLGYRNKMTFRVQKDPFRIGLYKTRSNEIVEIKQCYLQSDVMNKVLNFIKQSFFNNDFDELVLKQTLQSELMIIFKGKKVNQSNIQNLIDAFDDIKSIYVNDELVYGDEVIIEQINNLKFRISPDSFFQVNTLQTANLYQMILDLAKFDSNQTVLDLYCGVGTISLFISQFVKKVIGVEINQQAIEDANLNKELNNIDNVEFVLDDATHFLSNLNETIDTVIVDPPRKGLTTQGIEDIIKTQAENVVYVSCNPVTLKRDLDLLSSHYTIKEVKPFDMFPQTSHVESVVLMSRTK